MTLEVLRRFHPVKTDHCVTGSMRHIYEFHGYPVSEDLLLGLGSGVGFIYWQMKDALPFLGGRANVGRPGEMGLEKTAGKRTGVIVRSFRTSSPRKAKQALLDLLSRGEPVMIYVDMGFLPYLHLPEGYHFGAHAIVVAGYDAEKRQALVADRDGELHPLSLLALAQARGSKYKPFPPRNAWYTFDFHRKRAPNPKEVRQAIQETARGMLHPPISSLGVRGIRTAAERIPRWRQIMNENEVRLACFNVYVFIDAKGGTGGGIFRYMYGRFLREAAAITCDERLSEVGKEVHAIGDLWQNVAETLHNAYTASSPASSLPVAGEMIVQIADREQRAWDQLLRIMTS